MRRVIDVAIMATEYKPNALATPTEALINILVAVDKPSALVKSTRRSETPSPNEAHPGDNLRHDPGGLRPA
eukprot:CAMPEP_0184687926 /NCGR_PEP_ID=MMETSP0312-20130426/27995_1 /TAXON_ID=31354 /ORGANISM="Compsopogon coeruleus, Strain SAG 36.94" /LENGTH=70 /DNA_ID=CAMNT_0027144549 /DNA_START=110 /DNA_END=321 /DNA_ORIENTATION=+